MIRIEEIMPTELDRIETLWIQLNEIHLGESVHFKEHFKEASFARRSAPLRAYEPENIKIDLVLFLNNPVAYAVTCYNVGVGEIESLFVQNDFRGTGIGRQLIERSLAWLEAKDCQKIEVVVASGHESVFGFYEKFGLYPQKTTLRRKS